MYLCICHAVKESESDRYHLIGTGCGTCIKMGTEYTFMSIKKGAEAPRVPASQAYSFASLRKKSSDSSSSSKEFDA